MLRLAMISLLLVGCKFKTKELNYFGSDFIPHTAVHIQMGSGPCETSKDGLYCLNSDDEIWIATKVPNGVYVKRYGITLYEHGEYLRVNGRRLESIVRRMRLHPH